MKNVSDIVAISGDFFTKEDLINLSRLQKQLIIEENIYATIEECIEIWSGYSVDLSAGWLFFPEKDEDILKYIKSNDYFISFENYTE